MPGASRKTTDIAGGPAIEGSPNVFINGQGSVRIGDRVESHGDSPHSPTPAMVQGSSTVLVNGLGKVRAGDAAACGHVITGSANVIVGD